MEGLRPSGAVPVSRAAVVETGSVDDAGCCQAYTDAIAAGQQQHGAEAVAVNMASLEEALRWNGEAVKNLKYEMAPRGRSVPTGMFWSSDHMWVVPRGTFPNFAIELTRWASGRDP